MRRFALIKSITTTYHMAGQAITFIDGVCELADPSPVQLDWLEEKIRQGFITEPTSAKKKTKPSKPAAKKKRG